MTPISQHHFPPTQPELRPERPAGGEAEPLGLDLALSAPCHSDLSFTFMNPTRDTGTHRELPSGMGHGVHHRPSSQKQALGCSGRVVFTLLRSQRKVTLSDTLVNILRNPNVPLTGRAALTCLHTVCGCFCAVRTCKACPIYGQGQKKFADPCSRGEKSKILFLHIW